MIKTIVGWKRLAIMLATVSAGLFFGCVALVKAYAPLKLRVMFASEQTKIFEQMEQQAREASLDGAIQCLQYVVNYYPSGTKQIADSRLDRMVERDRTATIREIIRLLRQKSGEDLGDDPQAWLKKYGRD